MKKVLARCYNRISRGQRYIKYLSISGAYQCRESQKMTHKKTDPNLLVLIDALKKASRDNGAEIWRDIALRLEKSKSNWAEVNLSKLERFTTDGDFVVVAGKVLGAGSLSKNLTVAAFDFSDAAMKAIVDAGGKGVTLMELTKMKPKGDGVKIMR
ncbi:MAG TPA: 50S ribosomal protein L18e [Methanomassiliicoccales archaeon]|nr:50S ribosomal protein L18e [Methanomassiliicoccales archaeon]